jgi:hypothetical protein
MQIQFFQHFHHRSIPEIDLLFFPTNNARLLSCMKLTTFFTLILYKWFARTQEYSCRSPYSKSTALHPVQLWCPVRKHRPANEKKFCHSDSKLYPIKHEGSVRNSAHLKISFPIQSHPTLRQTEFIRITRREPDTDKTRVPSWKAICIVLPSPHGFTW